MSHPPANTARGNAGGDADRRPHPANTQILLDTADRRTPSTIAQALIMVEVTEVDCPLDQEAAPPVTMATEVAMTNMAAAMTATNVR